MKSHMEALDRIVNKLGKEDLKIISNNADSREFSYVKHYVDRISSYEILPITPDLYESLVWTHHEIGEHYFSEHQKQNLPALTGGDHFSIQTSNGIYILEHIQEENYLFSSIIHDQETGVDEIILDSVDYISFSIETGIMAEFDDPNLIILNDPQDLVHGGMNYRDSALLMAVAQNLTNAVIYNSILSHPVNLEK